MWGVLGNYGLGRFRGPEEHMGSRVCLDFWCSGFVGCREYLGYRGILDVCGTAVIRVFEV